MASPWNEPMGDPRRSRRSRPVYRQLDEYGPVGPNTMVSALDGSELIYRDEFAAVIRECGN